MTLLQELDVPVLNIRNAEDPIMEKRPPKRKYNFSNFETEESRGLSTEQLQRLWMCEEIQLIRIQREYYTEELKNYISRNELYSFL